MKHIIQYQISKGDKLYVAQGVNIPVVTQAKTLDELTKNIQEATELVLQEENLEDFNLAPSPTVLINLELPTGNYA